MYTMSKNIVLCIGGDVEWGLNDVDQRKVKDHQSIA